jgi:hypothetical protein
MRFARADKAAAAKTMPGFGVRFVMVPSLVQVRLYDAGVCRKDRADAEERER